MKKLPLVLLLTTALASPLAALAANGHDSHGSGAQHELQLNAGKKWGTDAPLRKSMTAIRTETAQLLPAVHAGKASNAQYDAYGKSVSEHIAYTVANCKLAPAADAQLHVIISEMMAGADAAQGKEGDKARSAGVAKIAQATNAYGKYFDHAGWKGIKLEH